MDSTDLGDRIRRQFSGRGERADIWRGFDAFLDTDRFLNLGYSARYESHLFGSPQRRLVDRVAREFLRAGIDPQGTRLLDVGCGRGGPTLHLTTEYGFDAIGIEFVPYNVSRARENARSRGITDSDLRVAGSPTIAFLLGDARQLPVDDNAFGACTAVDSIVYVPETRRVFAEIERVLEPGGVAVVTDLLVDDRGAHTRTVDRFADAWDMPPLESTSTYVDAIEATGLDVVVSTDISGHSVDRFRKWTRLYRSIEDGPLGPALHRTVRRFGLDPDAVGQQVKTANDALPSLRHVLVRVRC